MARIRTIKPEFFTSEQVVACSVNARLTFIGLWCFSDDGGIHPASAKRIKMEVFPAEPFTDEEVRSFIEELKSSGLVHEFESEGKRYLHVTGWDKHQKIDRPTFKYPCPDGQQSTIDRRTNSELSSKPRDGMEWNGMERNGINRAHIRAARSSKESDSKTKPERFTKPSIAEVREYCRQRKNSVNPEMFVDHYESNGWKVGKNQMKDWQATVRKWEKMDLGLRGPFDGGASRLQNTKPKVLPLDGAESSRGITP